MVAFLSNILASISFVSGFAKPMSMLFSTNKNKQLAHQLETSGFILWKLTNPHACEMHSELATVIKETMSLESANLFCSFLGVWWSMLCYMVICKALSQEAIQRCSQRDRLV